MRSKFFLAALLSFGLSGAAAAHSIWVEREGDGARIYFGEFDENLREASPGLLDRLKPGAKVAGSDKALKAIYRQDFLEKGILPAKLPTPSAREEKFGRRSVTGWRTPEVREDHAAYYAWIVPPPYPIHFE